MSETAASAAGTPPAGRVRRRVYWLFAAAFLVQPLLLFGMISDRAWLLARGTEITLPVVPVDPRDLLRGDYVVLRYDISRLRLAAFGVAETFMPGDTVYVSLQADGDVATAAGASHRPPASGLFLRGTVESTAGSGSSEAIFVDYGLEKFFVPEGAGRELERLRNDQKLTVDVAVGANGRAALKRLRVDGAVRYADSLF